MYYMNENSVLDFREFFLGHYISVIVFYVTISDINQILYVYMEFPEHTTENGTA